MKRLLSLIIAAVLTVSLAGCSIAPVPPIPSQDGSGADNDPLCVLDESYTYYIRTIGRPRNYYGGFISSDREKPNIDLYGDGKNGYTLEEFGQMQAKKHNVFCNMMGDSAVLNYYYGGYFCQDYITELNGTFFTVSYGYISEKHTVSGTDMSFMLPVGYTGTADNETAFEHETDFAPGSSNFPDLSVRTFAKDYFTADKYDAAIFPGTTKEQFTSYAEDGWTLDEWLKLYGENHELVKGEVMKRNGLELTFVGFVENGIFNVRAVIDDGDGYVLLCASDDSAEFQHVTNAIIDTISRKK